MFRHVRYRRGACTRKKQTEVMDLQSVLGSIAKKNVVCLQVFTTCTLHTDTLFIPILAVVTFNIDLLSSAEEV